MPNYTIAINSNNVSGANKNQYNYNFINGSFKVGEGATISIRSVVIPYSWFNVNSSYYQNQSFQFTWADGSLWNVTLPNGFYQVSDINQYLQEYFIANGLYLIDASGNNVYYIVLLSNQNYYANQILSYVVPLTLPSGYSQPSNIYSGFYPTPTAQTPLFTVLSAYPNFGSLIGFSVGSYPAVTQITNYSVLSNITPNLTPVNAIVMLCNLISNTVAMPSNILDSFTLQNTTFGSDGLYEPPYKSEMKIKEGQYNSIQITFVDQNFNNIVMNDSNILINLILTTK